MNKSKNTDVGEALDLLSSEVREEIQRIRGEGAEAMKNGDYDTAKSVIEFAGKLESFAGDVDKLVEKWGTIAVQHDAEPEVVQAIVGKSFFGKAKKGTITPHRDFYVPLLTALVQLGGKAKPKEAIARIGKLMAGNLKPKDYESLKSGSDIVRWENKVRWARSSLVNQLGYMRDDLPNGIWAISDKGQSWLESQIKPN